MKRLWEVDHPYYFTGGATEEHASWADFISEMGDADDDYNLVFRWDWNEGEDHDLGPGQARLVLGYVHQRKGTTSAHEVAVTRDDEPKVRKWLANKLAYLLSNWTPLEPAPVESP